MQKLEHGLADAKLCENRHISEYRLRDLQRLYMNL